VGCFEYSPVEGARANELEGQGSTQQVLVDEVTEDHAIARSTADSPEIDGIVTIEDGQSLSPGEFTRVEVHQSDDHDLTARLIH
jgi:ribosomal protein S12 methylthiotransferase